ncbi:integrase [Enterococcus nangangensis]|uniref:integrase n=1 Tax=Enterococcus nangangensis TaxID=2559926 RepID=UPI0010F6F686|nr:integrase [Enterococcus nangangensis]
MDKWRFERCKKVLKDYPNAQREIEKLEESIRVPYRETDNNSGIKGSGKQPDAMFDTLWTIESCKALNQIKRNKQAVDELLAECGNDAETIIRELYIRRFPRYKMQGLVEKRLISCGRSKAFDLRDKFFEELDKLL